MITFSLCFSCVVYTGIMFIHVFHFVSCLNCILFHKICVVDQVLLLSFKLKKNLDTLEALLCLIVVFPYFSKCCYNKNIKTKHKTSPDSSNKQ